jgi:glycosyltransferase involved in cell wall biosynthesis
VHIGLFTQHDSALDGGPPPLVEAIIAHRPYDAAISRYSAPAGLTCLLAARELLRRAEADHVDVVHIASSGPLAVVALLVASRFGLPVIGSFQPPTQATSGLFISYVRALVRQSRRLLVTSMAAREAFLRAGVAGSRIMVWRPGVDASIFSPSRRSAVLRERWGVSDAKPAVLYAGALADDRGARCLLSLELALHRTRPMHQLVVAGDGPSRNAVQARCPNAIFLGAVPRADMPAVLASADLFVYPSEAISTNLGVLEAQASGLPVVVMEGGSARERTSNQTAIACLSHADFIVATAMLARTDERRKVMGIAAREYAKAQKWTAGLTVAYAEYRAAAEASRVRRDLEPAFISQSRRL